MLPGFFLAKKTRQHTLGPNKGFRFLLGNLFQKGKFKMNKKKGSLILLLLAFITTFAYSESEPVVLTLELKEDVVSETAAILISDYVEPEVGRAMADALTQSLNAGEYAAITDVTVFTDMLTSQIREISNDEHLWIAYSDPPMQTSDEIDNPTPQEEADWLAMQQHFNFGLNAVSKLRGNIGYLDYTAFMDAEPSAPAIGNAMDFLQHTGGLIIDLRKNSGGMPDAVALLASYFVGPEQVHFNSIFWRDTDTTEEFWTRTDLEGTWYGKDRPVIILTSSETFSAAEDFTYGMKANKRAIVVGETTRGGANPGGIKRVSSNFSIWISSGKAINPITGSNWEGTGITPDHLTSAENARIEAEKRLLELVIARTDDPQAKHDRQQALEALEAEL